MNKRCRGLLFIFFLSIMNGHLIFPVAGKKFEALQEKVEEHAIYVRVKRLVFLLVNYNNSASPNEYLKLADAAQHFMLSELFMKDIFIEDLIEDNPTEEKLKKFLNTAAESFQLNLELRLLSPLLPDVSTATSMFTSLAIVGTQNYILYKIPFIKKYIEKFDNFFNKRSFFRLISRKLIKDFIQIACTVGLLHAWKNNINP